MLEDALEHGERHSVQVGQKELQEVRRPESDHLGAEVVRTHDWSHEDGICQLIL